MWLLAFAFVLMAAASASSQSPDAPEVLAQLLRDASTDELTKQNAALRLGCVGGDQAARYLEGALRDSGPTTRPSIARALGSTRSRLAVPVPIGMFRDDSARDEVCDALVTLTHRTWCGGGEDDDVALRKAWRRWWSQMKSRVEIYESDSCRETSEPRVPIWNW